MKKHMILIEGCISHSETETKKIGEHLAKKLIAGDVVALYGNLGAGKTTLVKGIARGLGVKPEDQVSSPTYVVIHEYRGKKLKLYHLDWYRLKNVRGVDEALAEECFYSKGITLVEWPERGEDLLPEHALRIKINHKNLTTRLIEGLPRL